MWISKKGYRHLQRLILANSAMLTALTQQLEKEGKLDGSEVMKIYNHNLRELRELIK